MLLMARGMFAFFLDRRHPTNLSGNVCAKFHRRAQNKPKTYFRICNISKAIPVYGQAYFYIKERQSYIDMVLLKVVA